MKPSAVGVKEGHDVDGHDLCVEGVGIFKVVVPNFINNAMEKLGHTLLGRLVSGIVINIRSSTMSITTLILCQIVLKCMI
jgi:hypothetical protein